MRFADLDDFIFRAVKKPRGSFAGFFDDWRETIAACQWAAAN
jgi:hypothetical protein